MREEKNTEWLLHCVTSNDTTRKSDAFLSHMTGDESCCHNFEPESKFQKTCGLVPTKKTPKQREDNQCSDKKKLQNLRHTINSKHPRLVLPSIYNACIHSENSMRNTSQRFDCEILQHPMYSPDLS